ncbi:hypothetical protein FB45DRAFT_943268 [Roridomyces roridus]|uniref:Uncharacterized protein n=1 Tax=Roridomyces roridus TaxID=1738132 RepID=A0AAD7B3Z9_9AGAR|nr:hypothetical protein FB45DRAFT_943268 [Roridomyces roridus]
MSQPNKGKTRSAQRICTRFSEAEEDYMVQFLAAYEPRARSSRTTFLEMKKEVWASNHSEESWKNKYKRDRAKYDPRIDEFLARCARQETQELCRSPSPESHGSSEEVDEGSESHRAFQDLPIPSANFHAHAYSTPISQTDRFVGEQSHELCRSPSPESEGSSEELDEGSGSLESPLAFQDLPIPFTDFHAHSNSTHMSETDRFLALNLAVCHLAVIHGLDPRVVYETWKLTGDLHLTDVHLRETLLQLASGSTGTTGSVEPEVESQSTSGNASSQSPPSPPCRNRRLTSSSHPVLVAQTNVAIRETASSDSESEADSDAASRSSHISGTPFDESHSPSSPSPTSVLVAGEAICNTVSDSDSDSEADAEAAAHMLRELDLSSSPLSSAPPQYREPKPSSARKSLRFQSMSGIKRASHNSRSPERLPWSDDEDEPGRLCVPRVPRPGFVSWRILDDSGDRKLHQEEFDRRLLEGDSLCLSEGDSHLSLFG